MTAPSSPRPKRRSRRSRRLLHNSIAFAVTLVGGAALLPLLPEDLPTSQSASIVLGYASFAFLLLTLTLGPRNVLLGRPNPVSSDLRRDLGIWGGATAAVHVVFAFQHHLGGDVVRYFFASGTPSPATLRRDAFGAGNDAGLVAAIILLLLVALSNDRALRRLGRRWKAWQRLNYGLATLVVIHTALFWRVLDRSAVLILPTAAGVAAVAVLQLLGLARFRRNCLRPAG